MDKNALLGVLSPEEITEIKGKFVPFQSNYGVEYITLMNIFDSEKKNLPFLYFKTKNHAYLGLTMARQSSDLLSAIAKKILQSNSSSQTELKDVEKSLYLIQYMFPKDFTSLKLIVFQEWQNKEQFQEIKNRLLEIQKKFLQKIQQTLKLIWSE